MIQNADINVGPASYEQLAPEELLVTSIFYTIQGEGPFAGKPAIFIRLAGCNRGKKVGMGCEFCDTKFIFGEGLREPPAGLIHRMRYHIFEAGLKLCDPLPLVVITGGEPMMQDNLVRVIPKLLDVGFPHVQIESNGDRLIPDFPLHSKQVSLVISPKVSHGAFFQGIGWGYRHPKALVWEAADAIKFVISGDPASPYFQVPNWAQDFPREVYLSPLAEYRDAVQSGKTASAWDHSLIDPELTRRNYQRAAELAMQKGFRISIQQHLFLAMP